MAAHGRYGNTADIRYIEGEWYRRCPDCQRADRQCWWPLALDFWAPKSMQRCRACNITRKRRMEREANAANPEAKRLRAAAYERKHRDQINARRRTRRRAARP